MTPLNKLLLLILIIPCLLLIQCSSPNLNSNPQTNEQPNNRRITFRVLAPTQLWRHWLEAGPVQAAEMVNDYDIQVIPEYGNIGDYNKNARISIEKSNAPDIVFANTNSLLEWAAKGDIQPLENCRERYDQFDNIASELWLPVT